MTRGRDLDRLEEALGWEFRNRELLEEALRHSSAANEGNLPSNERLEFLGDAALSLAVAQLVFVAWPDAAEGELTRGRAALVRERTLAEVGEQLGIGRLLVLGGGLRAGHAGAAAVADATEAVLGALLLDAGWGVLRRVVKRLLKPLLAALEPARLLPLQEPKTALQELAQRRRQPLPVYREVGQRGPAHDLTFVFEVELAGEVLATGEGSSKRAAQQAAARAALERLGVA